MLCNVLHIRASPSVSALAQIKHNTENKIQNHKFQLASKCTCHANISSSPYHFKDDDLKKGHMYISKPCVFWQHRKVLQLWHILQPYGRFSSKTLYSFAFTFLDCTRKCVSFQLLWFLLLLQRHSIKKLVTKFIF